MLFNEPTLIKSKDLVFVGGVQMHSGKMSTSCTNTWLNKSMIHYAFHLLGRRFGIDYDFLVEGDDNIIFYNYREDYDKVLKIIHSLGFSASVEHCPTLGHVEFCGLSFFMSQTDGPLVYRSIPRCFSKFGYSNSLVRSKRRLACIKLGKSIALLAALGSSGIVRTICKELFLNAGRVWPPYSKTVNKFVQVCDSGDVLTLEHAIAMLREDKRNDAVKTL